MVAGDPTAEEAAPVEPSFSDKEYGFKDTITDEGIVSFCSRLSNLLL